MNRYITATIALALAFTFNACDSGGGGGGGFGVSSSSGGLSSNGGGSSSSVLSSSSSSPQSGIIPGTPVTHGGETYETVVIGTQTWFKRNLNYYATGSKCYGEGNLHYSASEVQSNCDKYGRLYDWATAMNLPQLCNSRLVTVANCGGKVDAKHKGICPNGWHIPSNADWNKLMRYVDGSTGTSSPYNSPTAGKYLKATSGWNDGDNGTDAHGFSALPGGNSSSTGNFFDVGINGYWWSASEDYSYNAYRRYMYYNDEGVNYSSNDKFILYSVRCLKD
jgi:uncharacterized protein (TIGR02145 family)